MSAIDAVGTAAPTRDLRVNLMGAQPPSGSAIEIRVAPASFSSSRTSTNMR